MEKASYGKLGINVYQGTTSYGLKFVLTPVKDAKNMTVGIAIRKGGSDDIESIGSTKIPLGTAHYLEHRMFQVREGDADNIFSNFDCYSNAFTSRTTTFYYFTTNSNKTSYKEPLAFLLNMVTDFYMSEEDVERERDIIIGEIETTIDSPAYKFENEVLKNSYFDSPLMNPDFIGSVESLKQVHLTTLRKFFKSFYGISNLVLFVTGKFNPKEFADYLETLNINDVKANEVVKLKKFENENYKKVKQGYSVIDSPDGQNYLGVGIKLPKREELVEKFGDLVFAYYEILPSLVFSNILNPVDKIINDGLILFSNDMDVIEDGEDAMLVALFESNSCDKLREALDKHLDNLSSCYAPWTTNFKAVKNSYLGSSIEIVGESDSLIQKMIEGYENHLAWPGIATKVLALSRGDMVKFLKLVSSSPRTYVKLQGKKGK